MSWSLWLPRSRGDGPALAVAPTSITEAAPLTRGWTVTSSRSSSAPTGCPAHAGMDPGGARHRMPGGRLPRSRGDGPPRVLARQESSAAAPLTRGWTRDVGDAQEHVRGCPAHAGMDRREVRRRRRDVRLPRSRGDGPRDPLGAGQQPRAAPLTRGWTPPQGPLDASAHGCPAHAGMDPQLITSWTRARWLPRSRGDGPNADRAVVDGA